MKKERIWMAVALLAASCASQETGSSEDENSFVLEDLAGREVTLKENSKDRVVCIGAGALRLYSYVGEVSHLVGVEDIDRGVASANPFAKVARPYYDLHEGEFAKLPSCGRGGPAAQQAEPDAILNCNPSLVISEYQDAKAMDDLQEKLGVPVLVVSYGPNSVFDERIQDSLTLLGKALGEETKAEALQQYILSSKQELEEKASSIKDEDKQSVYLGCLGNWGTQDIFSTSPNFPLFNVSGIKNAVMGSSLSNGKIDEEKLLAIDPDLIVLDAAGMERFRSTYAEKKATFDSLKAFQNGNVYLEMPFNAYYTNLEVALMDAYYLASVAYPSAYAGFDIASKSNEITTAFLGKGMYDSLISKPYSYGGYQRIENVSSFFEEHPNA